MDNIKQLYVIGDPIAHSKSPKLFNHAFEKLNIDNQYTFSAKRVLSQEVESFVKSIRELDIRGASCTIPHKVAVIPFLDQIDPLAKEIGAVNTIVNDNGNLKGYNTDIEGILKPIEAKLSLENKNVAILGAGGAARAAVCAMKTKGAKVTIYNRNLERAKLLSKDFDCDHQILANFPMMESADLILNMTSVGMNSELSPVVPSVFNKNQVVFDAVYTPENTKFLKDAKEKGSTIISGVEMFLNQALAQFKYFTGLDLEIDLLREAFYKE
ncbi:UNVERIFIED_CONTAM: hypothetical protein GTU68_006114 [Idotea baltica]|nr:hypothetical protein [Idotea baltica]